MPPTGPKLGKFCTASNRYWSDSDVDDVVSTEVFSTAFSSAPAMLTALNFIDIMPPKCPTCVSVAEIDSILELIDLLPLESLDLSSPSALLTSLNLIDVVPPDYLDPTGAAALLTVITHKDTLPRECPVDHTTAIKDSTIGIKASTEEVRGDQFTMRIGVWGDGDMSDNGCNWLAVSPGDTRFRTGTYRINRRSLALPEGGYAPAVTLPVVYDASFPSGMQPTVVVWLSGFQMAADDRWHLAVSADAVSATGFSLVVSAPHASLYQATIAWFAYEPGAAESGRFEEEKVNAEQADYETTERKNKEVLFETPFDAVPAVMQGVCSVEFDESPCITVQVYDPTVVKPEGFSYSIGTWGCTVCDKVGVAYLALGDR